MTPAPRPTASRPAGSSAPTPTHPPTPTVPAATPTEPGPSLLGVPVTDAPLRTEIMPSRNHFPESARIMEVDAAGYNTVPPTSGMHWPQWSKCGFYNHPLPDELLVHNLEHGNIVISYNLVDEMQVAALRAAVADVPLAAEHAIVRRYYEIPEGMVAITTWGVVDRMVAVDAERIARFFREFPANTGPEFPNGLPCTTGVDLMGSSGS